MACLKKHLCVGAVIAQWICLHLPSCCLRFESQAHYIYFYHLQYLCYISHVKITKINKKRPGLAHFFKNGETFVILVDYVQTGEFSGQVLREGKPNRRRKQLQQLERTKIGLLQKAAARLYGQARLIGQTGLKWQTRPAAAHERGRENAFHILSRGS